MTLPIQARKTDYFYRVWFCFVSAIALFVDITPLYPKAIVPKFLSDVPEFYYEQFKVAALFASILSILKIKYVPVKDPLFDVTVVRPWFDAFIWLEAFVLVPIQLWMIWGLTRDHHLVPVNLLIYALQTLLTTVPCVAELYQTDLLSAAQKAPLFGFYMPYLLIPAFMVIEAYGRLNAQSISKQRSFEFTKTQ